MRTEYCEWAEKTQQAAERIEGMPQEERDQYWIKLSDHWIGGGKPKIVQMDFETYGEVDLGNCGSYRYIGDDSFESLLLAVAFDDEPVFIIDTARGEEIPDIVWAAIFDDDIIKSAWNAQFERTILGKLAGHTLSPDSWRCSMVWSASLSLPLALKKAAAVLKTGEQKDKAGEALIKYVSGPISNCELVNLEDMLQNGTVITDTLIEKPHSFSTACNIATQIIAQVASNTYGGQTISLAHLAPFVDVSRQK